MNEDKQCSPVSNVYNRRRFMQLASMAAGGTLLAACGESGAPQTLKPISATTLPQSQIEATVTASVGKTYFPGGPHVPDAYTAPPPAFQTVKYVPGTGKRVRAFEIFYVTPSVPKGQNKFWQELDKRLNVDWEVMQIVSDDYDTKTAIALNSSSPPDLFLIANNDSVFTTALQQGAFNDLTSFLSGDGLKEFPNLARIAPSVWQNSRFQGKIFGVPRSRTELGDVMMYRKDWADRLGLGVPQNPNEYLQMLTAFTKGDPTGTGRKVWGFGGRAMFGMNHYITNLFGVPNNWRVESDGSFTSAFETDEFRQSLDFERRLWAAGVYHPDSPTMNNKQGKTGFEAGKYGAYVDGIASVPAEQKNAQVVDPNAQVHILVPTNNQGKYTRYLSTGSTGMTGIPSQATSDPDRIKELLRILDYLSAPAFSLEWNFLTYGFDNWDSTIGSHGVRQLTSKGQNEIGELTVLANGPTVYYLPENLSYAVYFQEATRQMVTNAIPDPSWGLFSPTLSQQRTALQTLWSNGFQRIVRGQDSLSALSTLIQQWKAQGGAKIKQELADAYHKVH
jgi:putative aldouronate transport system substrate-binding protein